MIGCDSISVLTSGTTPRYIRGEDRSRLWPYVRLCLTRSVKPGVTSRTAFGGGDDRMGSDMVAAGDDQIK